MSQSCSGVLVRRQPQIADHRVDVVLEFRYFAARVNLNGSGQIAFGDSGRNFRDRTHLTLARLPQADLHCRSNPSTRLPRPAYRRPPRRPSTPIPGATAAVARRRGERAGHVVDRLGERGHLALGYDREVLFEVARGDRGHDLDYPADLLGQIAAMMFTVSVKSFHVPATPETIA